MKLAVEHGALIEVLGPPVVAGGITFLAARVELEGVIFESAHHLRDHARALAAPEVAAAIRAGWEAAWVRARLPRATGVTPPRSEVEKTLLAAGFVACLREGEAVRAIPFVCDDYYGKAGLMFSRPGPPAEACARIAAAFWDLLLARPDDLAEFEERVYHPGAGVWLAYSCRAGEVRCDETGE